LKDGDKVSVVLRNAN